MCFWGGLKNIKKWKGGHLQNFPLPLVQFLVDQPLLLLLFFFFIVQSIFNSVNTLVSLLDTGNIKKDEVKPVFMTFSVTKQNLLFKCSKDIRRYIFETCGFWRALYLLTNTFLSQCFLIGLSFWHGSTIKILRNYTLKKMCFFRN